MVVASVCGEEYIKFLAASPSKKLSPTSTCALRSKNNLNRLTKIKPVGVSVSRLERMQRSKPYIYSYPCSLHQLQLWPARFFCRDSDYFSFKIATSGHPFPSGMSCVPVPTNMTDKSVTVCLTFCYIKYRKYIIVHNYGFKKTGGRKLPKFPTKSVSLKTFLSHTECSQSWLNIFCT